MPDNTFSIPRPASAAPGLTGQPPLPVGKPMILKSPSPGERAVLEELGWQEGQPVPDNLGALIQEAKRSAANVEEMAPPIPLNTPPLQMPKEQDINQLPQTEQQRYLDIVKQAMAVTQAQYQQDQDVSGAMINSAGAGVNNAIRAAMTEADSVIVENDLASPTYSSGPPKPEPAVEKPETPQHCPNCGWDVNETDPIAISDVDKELFLQAVLGGIPFVKTYKLYGDKYHMTVRTLAPAEIDLCFHQRMIDIDVGRIKSHADELELLTRYRASLQVVEIQAGTQLIRLPRSLEGWKERVTTSPDTDDTPLRQIWETFQSHACPSEMLHRAIMTQVHKFNALVRRLEDNSSNPDFW